MITNDMIINYPFEYIEEQIKTEMENTDLNEMFDTYCKYSIEISETDTWFFQVYFPIVLTILDSHYHSNEDRMYDSLKKCATAIKKCQGSGSKEAVYFDIAIGIEYNNRYHNDIYFSNGLSEIKRMIPFIKHIEYKYIIINAEKYEHTLKNEYISSETVKIKSLNKCELNKYINDKQHELITKPQLFESNHEMISRAKFLLNKM